MIITSIGIIKVKNGYTVEVCYDNEDMETWIYPVDTSGIPEKVKELLASDKN